jgi:hypothetical protein
LNSNKKASKKSAASVLPKEPRENGAGGKKSKGFTEEERAAMKERAKELKAEAEKAVLEKIAALAKKAFS